MVLIKFAFLVFKATLIATIVFMMWPFAVIYIIYKHRQKLKSGVKLVSAGARVVAGRVNDTAVEVPRDLIDTQRGLEQMGIPKQTAARIARETYAELGHTASLDQLFSAALKRYGANK